MASTSSVPAAVAVAARPAVARHRLLSVRRYLWPESGALSPIPALDGMRALAALLVLVFHAWSYVPGYIPAGRDPGDYPLFYGKTGVNLFFVLSGFLLFLPYAQWIFGQRQRPSALAFYKRRALRVGPAYWVSLILLFFLAPLTLATIGDLAIHTVFLANISWGTMYTFNGVFWTMAIEVQFYATLPLIAWGIHRLTRRLAPGAAILAGMLGLCGISLLAIYVEGTGRFSNTPVVSSLLISYASLPYWLAVFGFGIGCAGLYTYVTKVAPRRGAGVGTNGMRAIGAIVLLVGVTLAIASAFFGPLQHNPLVDQTFGLGYAGLLLGVLFGPRIFRMPFEWRPMRFLGLISYSFYIWHKEIEYPAAHVIRSLPVLQQQLALGVLTLVGTTLVAYVSYQFVERPFINARKRAHEKSMIVDNIEPNIEPLVATEAAI